MLQIGWALPPAESREPLATAATKADVVAVIDQIFAILTAIWLPARARSKRHCEDCCYKNIYV